MKIQRKTKIQVLEKPTSKHPEKSKRIQNPEKP
jgi:hypothetical protein